MKLVGVTMPDGNVHVAASDGDERRVLAPVDEFWADPDKALASGGTAIPSDLPAAPPVPPAARVFCVGLNYRAHAAEGSYRDQELPPYPTIFARWTSSLSVDGVPAPVPSGEPGLDWEGEIAAYVGTTLIDAGADTARAAVLGYSTFNDLTSRTAQKLTSQWTLGKNGDFSGPLGPVVTADEARDLRDGVRVQTRVNGQTVQDGNTRDMIYELGEVLSLISGTITLRPGDIICTGTPEGVGYSRTPPWLLHPGDVVEVEVDGLGVLTTPIEARQ